MTATAPMIGELAREIEAVVGPQGLISRPEQLRVYESDGLTVFRQAPALVVLPVTTEEVRDVVRLCRRYGVPFVPRGSGTGLSGGALPVEGCVVIGLSKMQRIHEVDLANQRIVVEPGVLNLWVTQKVAPHGYYYAPDPSSQQVCSIGGNVAENSGGAHCLKYGFTVNHVLGMEIVTPDGDVVEIGGAAVETPGYDLPGIFVGSEGMLGICTKITLRLVRRAESIRLSLVAFDSTDAAGEAVSGIIGAGIVPSAIEMMDNLAIQATEAATHAGYPLDAGAVLLVELDGRAVEVDEQQGQVEAICRAAGATEIRIARDAEERTLFWKGRKAAFAAMGRLSPNYIVQDGVIPRTKLPQVLREIAALGEQYGLRVANVFHAGDGNLHPLVLYPDKDDYERAEHLAGDILKTCVAHGGSITGEHGVGVEKQPYMSAMFTEADMETHQMIRCAFNPGNLCNPGKVYPTPRLCGETPGKYTPHPLELAGVADRF
ncbi:MAG: Glycolate dehydrogenase, subunit GlcD [uncultured Thermomicrobiales bacterium]|uniref:Glycolate dehydrogenase, subunit GlcD n=1 Tax=uncultured Thermomicrobiales bacterium TaxID=1645740 RepID=A0A6J4VY59_9BACT|nr:MAG: Glycolate dehydrogenase, subunit GlcD [uncultured Thermomicrobiales bacterium]